MAPTAATAAAQPRRGAGIGEGQLGPQSSVHGLLNVHIQMTMPEMRRMELKTSTSCAAWPAGFGGRSLARLLCYLLRSHLSPPYALLHRHLISMGTS